MNLWRSFLALVDPHSANPSRFPSPIDGDPAPGPRQWAVPFSIGDCGALTDALYAFDHEVREAAFGDAGGSPIARQFGNRIAELVGAAYMHGYQLVPIDVEWLTELERLLNEMCRYSRTRQMRTTREYARLLRTARVYAGMAPVAGWALNQRYGTEWLKGEPVLTVQVGVSLPGDAPRP